MPLTEREAREAYSILAELECLGLAQSGRLIRADVVKLKQANKAFWAARKKPLDAIAADNALHILFVERSANDLLVRLVRNLHRIVLRYEYLYMSDTPLIAESVAQHDAIIAAIAAGNLGAAAEALRDNYLSGMQAVIGMIRQ